MKTALALLVLSALIVVAYAGAGAGGWWDIDDARMAVKIEFSVDKSGAPQEMEYHWPPANVPQAVQDAMDALHPGGPFTDAEKEYEGGQLYWELTREQDGREIEAMFSPDGKLHSEEIEVAADSVPAAVREAVARSYGKGTIKKWETIMDGKRQLVEYHVKLVEDGRNYKVKVSPGGVILGAYLEIVAEIEVPAPPR